MVIWVCEASEVNNLTVLAVGPNGHNKNKDKDKDKIASSGSDPPMGSDKNRRFGIVGHLLSIPSTRLQLLRGFTRTTNWPFFKIMMGTQSQVGIFMHAIFIFV